MTYNGDITEIKDSMESKIWISIPRVSSKLDDNGSSYMVIS